MNTSRTILPGSYRLCVQTFTCTSSWQPQRMLAHVQLTHHMRPCLPNKQARKPMPQQPPTSVNVSERPQEKKKNGKKRTVAASPWDSKVPVAAASAVRHCAAFPSCATKPPQVAASTRSAHWALVFACEKRRGCSDSAKPSGACS